MGLTLVQRRFSIPLIVVSYKVQIKKALTNQPSTKCEQMSNQQNHSTQDSHVVPHHGTNWAALWLTAQIRRDAVLTESYGRG